MLEEQNRESPVITRRYVCDQLKWHHSGSIRDRESSYLDGFTASIIRFALIVDELGMYPKKVGAELTKVLDLRGTDNQADDPLVGDLKRSIVKNAILNRICTTQDQREKVINLLERSDALKAVIELIGSEVVQRAFKNGQDIAATTALDGAEEQCKLKLPKGFPEVQEIEQFVRGLFKDQPVFCVSKILECSVNKPSAQQNASRRAIGQIFDCLRAAQVAPDGDLTKLVVARFILCDVDHHLGARFRKSADELYEYRKSLSESAFFGQPSKPLAGYVQEQVSLQEEVYLVGLRGKLHEEIQNFSHSVFQSRGGNEFHLLATNAILLALTTELDPPFQRQQLLTGSLLPALSAIAEGRFEELRTIVLRMALTCPETMPLATSRLLGIPDHVRSVLDVARVAVAKACGFIQREGTPALDKTSNEFFTELDDAVSCLEGLKDSMQGFEEALASTVEILKELIPSNLDEYYLRAGHFEDRAAQERAEPDQNYAAHLQDQSDIAYLDKGLNGKGTNFIRNDGVLVTVDSSTWSYGQSGIQVRVIYTYPGERRLQREVFTNVSKVRNNLDTGVWKLAENKDH